MHTNRMKAYFDESDNDVDRICKIALTVAVQEMDGDDVALVAIYDEAIFQCFESPRLTEIYPTELLVRAQTKLQIRREMRLVGTLNSLNDNSQTVDQKETFEEKDFIDLIALRERRTHAR